MNNQNAIAAGGGQSLNSKRLGFPRRSMFISAIIILMCSALMFLSNLIMLLNSDIRTNGAMSVGSGFWVGILGTITAVLGLVAHKRQNNCSIVAYMVLCVVLMVLLLVPLVTSSVTMAHGRIRTKDRCGDNSYEYDYYYGCHYTKMSKTGWVAFPIIMLMASLVGAGSALWGSILACKTVCPCGKQTGGVAQPNALYRVMYVAGANGQPTAILVDSKQRPVLTAANVQVVSGAPQGQGQPSNTVHMPLVYAQPGMNGCTVAAGAYGVQQNAAGDRNASMPPAYDGGNYEEKRPLPSDPNPV